MPTITRFAPSPTGKLHLGGARTALFNYLHARSNDGTFKIRIEDTDKSRNITQTSNEILESLNWLGFKIDGPMVFQSKNIKNHLEVADSLISNGLAYKCFHDDSYITEKKMSKQKFISEWRDGKKQKSNKPYVIRIKAPLNGNYTLKDEVQGKIVVNFNELDDYIIVRTDKTPTFLLSSVVDDVEMKISDIIRGDDHLTNTFRQKIIFDFLNYKPNFAHISLLHNDQNQKMSKRDNSISVLDYKKKGYLPEALNNYLLRLGWSHGDQEFFSLQEAVKLFSLSNLGKSPAKLDEKKLNFLNSHYLRQLSNTQIYKQLEPLSTQSIVNDRKIMELIDLYKERSISLEDIGKNLFNIIDYNHKFEDNEKKILKEFEEYKSLFIKNFTNIKKWDDSNIELFFKDFIDLHGLSFKSIAQPIRLLITGNIKGPSVYSIIRVLGKTECLKRIMQNFK
ncbi:MAG: glutamate--tRNA ligase [Alphaproteobacteria bacterium]